MFDRRLLIVAGKGGAGRSAVTASIALRAAKAGRRVLALAVTDAAGLAAHLRIGTIGLDPTPARPSLHASAVEPASALDQYLRLRLRVPRMAAVTRAFRVLAETVPGIRDTVVMGKVIHESSRSEWDLVVADAPPTGQVLSYLRAPATIEGLVPSGRIRGEAAWMRGLLADPEHSGLVVVATPEELPVTEALETMEAVQADGLVPVAAVVANRVVPPLGVSPETVAAEPPGPRRDAALMHELVTTAQEPHLRRLPHQVTFPLLFGIRTPGEVASLLSELWSVS